MKTLATLFALALTTATFAQFETTWIGGTYGQEDAWNCASNWSGGDVPDEDSHVIIKFVNSGHYAQPIITEDIQVAAIEIHSLAKLVITDTGSLIVDGSEVYSEGISLYGGSVENHGSIFFYDLATDMPSEDLTALSSQGKVFVENKIYGEVTSPQYLTVNR